MTKSILLIFVLLIGAQTFAKGKSQHNRGERVLSEFSSDGCSAYPDGLPHTQEYEWLHCCFAHDMRYWLGGTFEQKAQADAELNRCVAEASLESHGALMEWGVFLGGGPMVSTRWRWGYGWNRLRPYKELSQKELNAGREKSFTILNTLSLDRQYFTDDQVDYILESYENFVDEIVKLKSL